MKEFLKKYLTEEQLSELETKYLAEHPESKGLPFHISKSRLDEVLGQKRELETGIAASTAKIDELTKSQQEAIDKAVKEAQKAAQKEHDEAIAALQLDASISEAVYKNRGKNVKAIKALLDTTKPVEEEMARLVKDEPYLFAGAADDIPGGTGKTGSGDGAGNDKELAAMRRAVGIDG